MNQRPLLLAFTLIFIVAGAGCAGPTKVLKAKTKPEQISIAQYPIVLFSVQTHNQLKTNYNPFPTVAAVLSRDGGGVRRENYNIMAKPSLARHAAESNIYLGAVCVPPGRHVLQLIEFVSTDGFFVQGRGRIPLSLGFEAKADSVTYLGRIDATNRERKGDEMRAGGVLPLIDQSVAGLSSGTFDVLIADASAEDIERFKKAFPVLQPLPVGKSILPSWKRLTDDDMRRAEKAQTFDTFFVK